MKDDNIEVFTSAMWISIKGKIEIRLQAAINRLINAKSWDEVCRFKGQIEALKSLAAMDFEPGDDDG